MSFRSIAIRGSFWTLLSTVLTSLLHLALMGVLARYLNKSDFGVVAIIMLVTGFVQTFSDLGFSTVVMHRKVLTDLEFSSLFWVQMFIFVLMFFSLYIVTPLLSVFFNESLLNQLMPIALVGLIFTGIGKLYGTVCQKEKKFKILAIRNIVSAIISFIIGVGLVINGFGVYSLVGALVFQTAIMNIWNYIAGQTTYKIRFQLNINAIKPLTKIGLYQTGAQLLDYTFSRLDIILLGKFLGTESLGIYNLAKDLITKAVTLVNSIGNSVALPLFAEIQDDYNRMQINYCKLLSILSIIVMPILAIVGGGSLFVVDLLYGSNYIDVSPILTVFSIWGMFVCVGNPVGNIIVASGRTDLNLLFVIIRGVLVIPVIYVLCKLDVLWVSIGVLVVEIIVFFVSWYLELFKVIGLSLSNLLNSFKKMLVTSIVFVSIMYCISWIYYDALKESFFAALVFVILQVLLYILLVFIFDKKQIVQIYTYFFKN